MTWTVNLPMLPIQELSLNAYLRYGHWKRATWRDVQRDTWLALLGQSMNSLHVPFPSWRYPVSIHVRLTGTGRRTDVPNWASHYGLKVLVDCLTEPAGNKQFGIGVIKGDSVRYVTAFSVTVEPDGEPGTEITISDH